MKDLSVLIQENLVCEGKFPGLDIESFISFKNDEIDMEEWPDYGLDELDDKYIDFIKNHCAIIERGGGYDGNGEDAYSYLDTLGFEHLDKLFGIAGDSEDDDYSFFDGSVELPFEDGELLDKDWLKAAGKVAGINAKIGSTYYTAGYETPTFVLFDQNNAMAKEIISKIEGWY